MSTDVSGKSARMGPIAIAAWLFALSIMVFADHQHFRHIASSVQTAPDVGRLSRLEARLSAVETQSEATTRLPPTVSSERFDSQVRAIDGRLTQLEQRPHLSVSQDGFDALANRVESLETTRARPRHADPTAVQSKAPSNNDTAEPPFRLLGLEQRGGETFLAIAPPRAVSLAEMSVLRIGDVQGGWQLESLDSKSATFRVQGQLRHLTLP